MPFWNVFINWLFTHIQWQPHIRTSAVARIVLHTALNVCTHACQVCMCWIIQSVFLKLQVCFVNHYIHTCPQQLHMGNLEFLECTVGSTGFRTNSR